MSEAKGAYPKPDLLSSIPKTHMVTAESCSTGWSWSSRACGTNGVHVHVGLMEFMCMWD